MWRDPKWRSCSTCQFWSGRRWRVRDENGRSKIAVADASGMCENSNSRFFEQERQGSWHCRRFARWKAL